MSPGQLPLDVEYRRLARDRGDLTGNVPLDRFLRLRDQLLSVDGEVSVALAFSTRRHRPSVRGQASVDVEVTCQRCMEPMPMRLEVFIDTLIVESEESMAALPPEEDGVICGDKRISVVDLIEDDLLINLPMSTRHERCAEIDVAIADTDVSEEVRLAADDGRVNRPFAALAELKKDIVAADKD